MVLKDTRTGSHNLGQQKRYHKMGQYTYSRFIRYLQGENLWFEDWHNIHVWIFHNPYFMMKSDTLKPWKYFFQNVSISSWFHHKIHAKQIKFSVTAISEGGNLIFTIYTPIRCKDILEENNIACPKHNYILPFENSIRGT